MTRRNLATRRAILAGAAAVPLASAAAAATPMPSLPFTAPDRLLTLIRAYESGWDAFDRVAGKGDEEADTALWERTIDAPMMEILDARPPATSPASALAALDHVLNLESGMDPFECRDAYPLPMMQWLLVKAARDFIAVLAGKEVAS